jgi:hypothetical protein
LNGENFIMRASRSALLAAAIGVGRVASSSHASFDPGTLVVVKVGDGAGAVPFDANNFAQSVSLDVFNATSSASVGSHALPSSGAAAFALSAKNDDADGHLNLSAGNGYLTLGGYRSTPGSAYSVLQSPMAIPRVVARIDPNWNTDTSTALTDAYDHVTITAVATTDGQHFWTGGDGSYTVNNVVTPTTTGGIRYVASLGASTTINLSQTQTTTATLKPDGVRNLRIVNGQLEFNTASQGSFTNRGVYRTTNALPTSGPQTAIGIITNHEGSATDFVGNVDPDTKGKLHPKTDSYFLDTDGNGAFDLCYSTGGKADLAKWSLVGNQWLRTGSTSLFNTSEEINALAGTSDATGVTLFAATDAGIYKLFDTGGYNGAIVSGTTFGSNYFISAPANTQFRGLAIVVPEPMSALALFAGAMSVITRRRRENP